MQNNLVKDTVTVDLNDRSYDILIGDGLLPEMGTILKDKVAFQAFFIITDSNVASLHLPTLEASLKKASLPFYTCVVEAGEQSKRFSTVETLLNEILDQRPERKVAIIALGGGVVGDLTGFVASILLRGVPFIQIPTTLLSQVDSSVGGKTGINTGHGKNLVGTFYQPELVVIDTDVLNTLPQREFLAGYAEVVKYGAIAKGEFFDWLDEHKQALRDRQPEALRYAIKHSCVCKAEIVAKDERESNVRALLNLGHTFGHAYEAVSGYSNVLLHGEGVSIGMAHAFTLSVRLGYCEEALATRFIRHMQDIGLPTSLKDIQWEWDVDAIMTSMAQDKKVDQGKLVFILVKKIGEGFIAKDVAMEAARDVICSDLLSC